ncbi:TetR/AcrR family transcriptional regulator [Pseudomonas turukhanskensis]|uniref:TetR family transcriptional regulator n=1 Tax=Pseudomonas turukhanskensis TaxID=1806536 RepID=A0A9W6KAU0_9PSED|nr:TetR/AcrR family transcriptional regulator [Pseudomonas turukhanskensis]GLK90845.1 TetR family transcriptional regulator [Pseudomonas turukhanskensis]
MVGIRQFNEEHTLERALEVFWRNGYGATSMPELAEATGVQRGSLYNAYGDKQGLFLAVFARYQKGFLAAASETLAPADTRSALKAFFTFAIASMKSGEAARGCLSTKTTVDENASAEPIREVLRGMVDGLESLLAERLRRASEPLALPVADAARLLVTLTRGIVVIERLYPETDRLQATADALIELIVPPCPAN